MTELEPISPTQAKEMYLTERRDELAEKTIEMQEYHLRYFVDWCDEKGIENLNNLTGRKLQKYRLHRRERGLSRATIRTQSSTIRVWLRWCTTIDAVEKGLPDKIIPPSLTREDRRETTIEADRAKEILRYLQKFRYASRDHAIFKLLWHTGVRMGTLRSIDLDDYQPQNQCIGVRHRPDEDTPLKNTKEAERSIALDNSTCTVLMNT